jgi:predicted RNA binding protein YcfA (HicA-like mRNA interferase family)
MKALDLIKLLEQNGWYLERSACGSHRIFKHPTIKGTIVVPVHGKKDLGIGLLNTILKQAGLK